MKVLMINEGALSDYEVFELMKERKDSRLHKSANVAYAERNWMDHKVLKFLSQTHSKCSQLDAEKIKNFLREVEKAVIQLTPAEKLQFINHIPVELVDVHLIVEDCAGRFSEAQIEELIQIVEQTLAVKQDEGDAANTDESA
uniref:DNA-directed RNA polymerase III subunit RPC9 n=1 Tax=Globisporangium ultimum (strain ATCC 200006 / CBS 805.95 / DAOM BR144) TaxID=431595 RepID=K3X3I4_GLOUD